MLLFIALYFTACEKKPNIQETQVESQTASKNVFSKEKGELLTLTDTEGKTHQLRASQEGIDFQGYEGKVILLDFFATWCPPCRAEMPHLVNLQNKFKDKIQILAILMEDEKENTEVKSFASEFDLNFPILNSKENFILSHALGGVKNLPTLVLYDSKGRYFTHYTGAAPEEMIESDIKKALAR
jgi:thiol-disulfide isomerase/thioredoxin